MDSYYDEIAPGYDELHKQEQLNKLNYILAKLPSDFLSDVETVLDVGCGTGVSSDFFAEMGLKVKGIDPSKGLIEQNKTGKSELIKASAENIPFEDNKFDLVVSFTAIQNFDDLEKGLLEMRRVGKVKFILTFLKTVEKSSDINIKIQEIFDVKEFCTDDKDKYYVVF